MSCMSEVAGRILRVRFSLYCVTDSFLYIWQTLETEYWYTVQFLDHYLYFWIYIHATTYIKSMIKLYDKAGLRWLLMHHSNWSLLPHWDHKRSESPEAQSVKVFFFFISLKYNEMSNIFSYCVIVLGWAILLSKIIYFTTICSYESTASPKLKFIFAHVSTRTKYSFFLLLLL